VPLFCQWAVQHTIGGVYLSTQHVTQFLSVLARIEEKRALCPHILSLRREMFPAANTASAAVMRSPTLLSPTKDQEILRAHAAGVITDAEKTSQLQALCGISDTADLKFPTRTKGTLVVQKVKETWLSVRGPYATVKEALKDKHLVDDGSGGLWAWNQPGQGCKKWFHCNAHLDCKVMLRPLEAPDGCFLQVTVGVLHNPEPKLKARTNSALTREQESLVKVMVEQTGCKPKQLMDGATLVAIEAGALKLPEGGMEGE
jgi:hypothetical protein